MHEPTDPKTIEELKTIYDALTRTENNTMPAYAKKLMPAVEAATMPYDRKRALRRAAIYDAWVNAGHYHKDIHLTDVALIEIALDAIEHVDINSSDVPTS